MGDVKVDDVAGALFTNEYCEVKIKGIALSTTTPQTGSVRMQTHTHMRTCICGAHTHISVLSERTIRKVNEGRGTTAATTVEQPQDVVCLVCVADCPSWPAAANRAATSFHRRVCVI